MTDGTYGSGTSVIPSCSTTRPASRNLAPMPPTLSGNGTPSHPSSPIWRHLALSQPMGLSRMSRTRSTGESFFVKLLTVSTSMRWSSVSWKSMGLCSGESEHHLGDDVLLNLVRARVDGRGAQVVVFGRDGFFARRDGA